MGAVATRMGLFEGYDDRKVFAHNVDLLHKGLYRFAGRMFTWSVMNGGPGLSCLSRYVFSLMLHSESDCPLESLDDVADVDYRNIVQKASRYEN